MSITENLSILRIKLLGTPCKLIAVSKTYPTDKILEAYEAGQRAFGENKVQEMEEKYATLPRDIEWHQIGHLQTNKVKYIAPFVSLIHSVDSLKLLHVIDKEAAKSNRIIHCLLQMHIASEETKFGFSYKEVIDLLQNPAFLNLKNVKIRGLMGMATNTLNNEVIRSEFKGLKIFFEKLKTMNLSGIMEMKELSMGMSSDFEIAIQEGSTMIRVGSAIFGAR